jgi:predicted nuclease of restriction endonuclease-like (RecB) superfamily
MPNQPSLFSDDNYTDFLDSLKQRIRTAQVKAALAVNRELVLLYWQIGREILERQRLEGWGSKVIQRLAKDLKQEFPDVRGFSPSNLKYMKAFAEAYPEGEIGQQLAGQIPWFHNCVLIEKVKDPEERVWYIQKTIENGWSRNVLVMQIESRLFERQGGAITNFERTLPSPQSDLAKQTIKDPYNFDFLTISENAHERALERGLLGHIRDFLMELGLGFSFLGSQYPIIVSEKEYRLDLLFYHVQLHCYVIIDLKMREFIPEFSGKMSFYIAAVDNMLRTDRDEPTIGIILCKEKDKTTVEFALQGNQQPIGVSTFQTQAQLPPDLRSKLPTAKQLETELSTAISEIEEDKSSNDKESEQD